MALPLALTELNLRQHQILAELPPLSPDQLSKGAPFFKSDLLDSFVPFKPGESGPDRLFNLDRCLAWHINVESNLARMGFVFIRESVRKLISAILIERHRTLEWMEYRRRQENEEEVSGDWSSSDETVVSLTSSQRRKKSKVDVWRPLSRRKVAEQVSSDFRARDERPTEGAMRLLSWLIDVPDGMPPAGSRRMHSMRNELATIAPAA